MAGDGTCSHVANGCGQSFWVLGDRITFKTELQATKDRCTLAEMVARPLGGPPPHLHHHEDEGFYILEGNFEFLVGDRTIPAPAGTFVYAPRKQIHQYRNLGPGAGRLLVWAQPARFQRFIAELGTSVESAAEPPPVDQATLQKLARLCEVYGLEMHPEAIEVGPAPARPPSLSHQVLGDEVRILCAGDATGGTLCVAEVTSPPGAGLPAQRHEAHAVFVMLDGVTEFQIEGRTLVARPGDVVHVPPQVRHRLHTMGTFASRYLCYHTPAGMDRFLIECAAIQLRGDSATQQVIEIGRRYGIEMTSD